MKVYRVVVGGLDTNCYLVAAQDGSAAIVDPGRSADKIVAAINEHGLKPQYILLTHGHFDHIGAVEDLKKLYGVPVYVHPADGEMLTDPNKFTKMHANIPPVEGGADRFYDDGDTIPLGGSEIKVMHTPGHTPGSVTLIAGRMLLTGDTLFEGDIGRTDFPGGDKRAMGKSLRKIGMLDGDYTVLPGHDVESTLETERKNNPYLRNALLGGSF